MSTDSVAVATLSDYMFTREQHTPRDPSDVSNLEFRAPKNIDQRGMVFERVPSTLRGGLGRAPISGPNGAAIVAAEGGSCGPRL